MNILHKPIARPRRDQAELELRMDRRELRAEVSKLAAILATDNVRFRNDYNQVYDDRSTARHAVNLAFLIIEESMKQIVEMQNPT